MKKNLIASVISLCAIGMTANVFAGTIALCNYSKNSIFVAYTKKEDNDIKQSFITNDPSRFKNATCVDWNNSKATFQINAIFKGENYIPVQCSGLELNKFFSTISIAINPDGTCTAKTIA